MIKEVSDQQVPPVLAAGKDTPVCQQTRRPPDNEGSHLGASARDSVTASIEWLTAHGAVCAQIAPRSPNIYLMGKSQNEIIPMDAT